MIVGLFTELLSSGGVQRAGRHCAAVLTQIAREQRRPCRLLSLNDPPGEHSLQAAQISFQICGFGRRKLPFILSALFHSLRAHLVYLNHPNLSPLHLPVKLLRPGTRCVVATHGVDVWGRIPGLRRWALQAADVVTAPSRFTASKLTEKTGPRLKNVAVLPWAIDPGFLGLKPPEDPGGSRGKQILTVSRMEASEKDKGVDTVLQALPAVLQAVPGARCVMVGDGTARASLEQLANRLGLENRVTFAGKQSDPELARYYAACDVFAMPSGQEGFGITFLEAMAFGKPVVGGNFGGTPDIIVEGVTGFLVDPRDAAALADRLVRLLTDADLRGRMGKAGRDRLEKLYTFELFAERFEKLMTSG